jgi:hypothetical protein
MSEISLRISAPIGAPVDTKSARRPQRVTLEGRSVLLAPLDAELHADALYEATAGHDALWQYLFEGPFSTRADFDHDLKQKASSEDPLFFAILDKRSRLAVGRAAYMRIEPRPG